MAKIFERTGLKKPRYSAFDLSREQKLSCNMGDLIPTYLEEVVPGDNFNVQSEIMIRLAPMIAPVMHRVNVYMHYFFVPNRIIWNEWEDFITGGREGNSIPPIPKLAMNETMRTTKLYDYLGLPTIDPDWNAPAQMVSALPFRAYQLIWNEYFRDQNVDAGIGDINDLAPWQNFVIRKRAWEKDYFTSALPWTQRGPSAGIPIDFAYKDVSDVYSGLGTSLPDRALYTENNQLSSGDPSGQDHGLARIENLEDEALNVDINDLRRSSALQRWLEKSALGGARYVEQLLSHFGVRSDDARLQRPEYLGGGRQPIVISEVLNTTGTEEAPQGDMAGHGISTGQTNKFNHYVKEHGYIMGIMSVLPKATYQQGIPRHYLRSDKFDYYFPEFAHLGEQEIKNTELYTDFLDPAENDDTFGYQQRFAEYKYGNSTVHGDFRDELDFWHFGRIFENRPALSANFMSAHVPDRPFAVQNEEVDKLWIQMYHKVKARRPMPHFSNPRLS